MNVLARQVVLTSRKDLLLERRDGEALLITAPFGAVALLLIPIAVGADIPLLRTIGPGMYWSVIVLFALLVALRRSAFESVEQSSMLRLAGVPDAARLFGGALASAALLLTFELVLAPVAVMLYDPDLTGWPWLLFVLPATAAGLALLGSIARGLLGPLGTRTTLGMLLCVPLALPLLLGATQTLEAASYGRSPLLWLVLLVIVDLVLFLGVLFVGQTLEEST